MDVVIRPEDIDIVDVKDGKMTGEVLSVLFKGVHYEIMVETVPGTSVTVNMRVIRNHDVTSEDGSEKISANNFYVDLDGRQRRMSTFPLQILNMNWKQKKDSIRLHSALQTEPASREPFS